MKTIQKFEDITNNSLMEETIHRTYNILQRIYFLFKRTFLKFKNSPRINSLQFKKNQRKEIVHVN